ncbi:MAG: caspase family protein [Hyphomicrobiaceae bacterium]
MRAICRGALAALTLFAFLGLWTGTATAQRRVALVIGNSSYVNTARLENPKNDAADMAETLKQLGFEVIEGRDLDKASMNRTIRNFAETLAGTQMALFFYAGHGLQVGRQNYLVPIDARLASAAALDFEMVRLDLIQRTMEREATTNVVILDACRDNPLSRNLARALGTRSASIGKGLAAVESGEGTLISYSTQPGNVALDGAGRNSPFAAALLKHIPTVGDDLPTILINVRNDVMAATERRQVPWEHSALTAKVYFKPPKPTGPTVDQQIEMSFWDAVKDTHNPAVLQTYLDRYPNGEFATIARALVQHYEQQAKAEQAARAEEQKRQEEARKAAEVKRLEDERRAKEEALAAERRRARETNDKQTERQIDEKLQTEAVARSEMLRKALEEVIVAREAAKAAEEQRLAAVNAAEEATKAAERTIAAKRSTDAADPTKVAALPKIEKPSSSGPVDGTWTVVWTRGPECKDRGGGTYRFVITNGAISGSTPNGSISGKVSGSGSGRWTLPAVNDGAPVRYEGTFHGSTGSGRFTRFDGRCSGTYTAKRG